ncbi:MAG: decarboxylase [Caldilineaceae bacterium SB0670_bin_27]|uniref:Decarboxylase n=1 Tax=Caldilineaceae bacterium SB0664_bin_27 TaxID=2605260 RepID=A0A6B0YRC8_9CHLR|nr:decarboxylase [Caldilineaceae bacterium SB0664_bin_27]MYJ76667.1 decarboxylase [Caldilineaceae bacterium SB0670_bin_27]
MLRIGILYPLHSAEDDYPRMAARLKPPVEAAVVHTDAVDLHTVEDCRRTGSWEHLEPGAAELRALGPDVCMWACTSGSFVYGLAGAEEQARQLGNYLGVPASSTSLSFVKSIQALGITRVAVAATYPEELATEFVRFLGEGGIQVVHLGSLGIWTAVEVGEVGREEVIDFVRANDHVDAEAILVPDTALHTVAFLPELANSVGKPVLTANQATMWEALRLAGQVRRQIGFGRLFEVD